MLVQYIKDNKGRKVGCVVAYLSTDATTIKMGWSKCDMKLDKFDKHFAIDLAKARAEMKRDGCIYNIPQSVVRYYNIMKDRAHRYYKEAQSIV